MWLVRQYFDDNHSPTLGDPDETFTVKDEADAKCLVAALFLEEYWGSKNPTVRAEAEHVVALVGLGRNDLALTRIEAMVQMFLIRHTWTFVDASGTDEDGRKRLNDVLVRIRE